VVEGVKGIRTIPPSLANANIILELLVRENKPQCHTQIMIKHINTTAPSSPNMSTNICRTGCPLCIVLSKFCILNRKLSITNKPKRALNPTELITPMGALQEALCVSSERWADASKPVSVYWATSKDELGALVSGGLCQHGNCKRCHTCRVQGDRGIVQIPQDVDTEGVDEAVGDEDGCVDTDGSRG
jgi:hypothetical protein